jgi:hypothetical protein
MRRIFLLNFCLLAVKVAAEPNRNASPITVFAFGEALFSWWRRGRIELPVQKKNVLSLLQA